MSNKCMKVHELLGTRKTLVLTHINTNENNTHTHILVGELEDSLEAQLEALG